MKYRREIDGLRAVAVLPVIFFHAGFKAFEGGYIGVDVFFVISGYLITSIILSDMDMGKFSIVTFYERRARRILPALFFVMLCCLPFAWFLLTPKHLVDFSQSLSAVSAFSSNILFWQESGYFGTSSELKPLLHTWSLAVEEQYYIFFPLFLMAIWKMRKRWIFGLLIFVGAVSFFTAEWGAYNKPLATFFLLPTRGWELLIGALIAFYFFYKKEHGDLIENKKKLSEILGIIGLLLILYSIFQFDKETPFPSVYAFIPTVGTSLVIIFSNSRTIVGRLLGLGPMVGIGLISYSTYLWHQPLFVFTRHISITEPSTALLIILSFSSIALAYLSWRFVKIPFRNKKIINRKAIFCFAVAGSVSFASVGLAGHFTDGFYNLKYDEFQKMALSSAMSSPRRDECHTDGIDYLNPQDACFYNSENIEWATFGDSHTVELAYALAGSLKEKNIGLKHFSFSGCGPISDSSGSEEPCSKWTNEAVEYISNNNSIKNVVVSYRINQYLSGEHRGFYPNYPNMKNSIDLNKTINAYVKIVNKFVDSGKSVYVVLQAPELPTEVEKLISKNKGIIKSIPGASLDWWNRRNDYFDSQLFRFNKNAIIVDPANYLCDKKNCYAVIDGVSMYFDDDHLSLSGAGIVASKIIEKSIENADGNDFIWK